MLGAAHRAAPQSLTFAPFELERMTLSLHAGEARLSISSSPTDPRTPSRVAIVGDCHGQWPSSSTSNDQLRNVLTTTRAPSISRPLAVRSSNPVRITSAATRISSASISDRPSNRLYALYEYADRLTNCRT